MVSSNSIPLFTSEFILRPWTDTLNIEGRISYDNNAQAWNTIRFKKDLIKEFPQLKEKRSKFSYKLIFYRTYGELIKETERMKKEKDALPLLLFLIKDDIKRIE